MSDDDDDLSSQDGPRYPRLAPGIENGRREEKKRAAWRKHRCAPKNCGAISDYAMTDIQTMNPTKDPNDVLFGVYGIDDWATCTHLKRAVIDEKNTVAEEGTWITPAGFRLAEWVMGVSDRFNFMSKNRALMFMEWGMVEAVASRGKLELELNGAPDAVAAFALRVDNMFKRAENLIEWVYGSRGQSISVPLNYRPAVDGSYPWLPMSLNEYIDAYLNSSASVLILLGPPGTGKTTFIKNLIHRSGGNAKITYDEKIMSEDSLFAQFIEGNEKFMIMEDADAFLKARTEGNTMMHRFLNVADGLISAEGKKLVFSTNLPGVKDIDPALMREGRCFDIVKFRPLTRAEATVVAMNVGQAVPEGDKITLAQIFSSQPSGTPTMPAIGFASR